jgi:hypothetical protein
MTIVDPLDPLYQWPPAKEKQMPHHTPSSGSKTPGGGGGGGTGHISKPTLLHAFLLFICFLLIVRIAVLYFWRLLVAYVGRFFEKKPGPSFPVQQQQQQQYQQQSERPSGGGFKHSASYY